MKINRNTWLIIGGAAAVGLYLYSKGSAAPGNYSRLQTMREELTRNWGAGNLWIEKAMTAIEDMPQEMQQLVIDYWLDYHVMGRGGQAPAGMMDQFNLVINQMVQRGQWPT